jgi:hypothetical protein
LFEVTLQLAAYKLALQSAMQISSCIALQLQAGIILAAFS